MADTKTVSLRLPVEDLAVLAEHGVAPTEVMREAVHAKARALKAQAWEARIKERAWKLPRGAPRSEDVIREDRDSR